jgi:hypothetical protein
VESSRLKSRYLWLYYLEEGALLEIITRLSNSEYPITLSLIRDLTKEIRSSYFRLTLTPASYSPISK